jgi:hypothetical protein
MAVIFIKGKRIREIKLYQYENLMKKGRITQRTPPIAMPCSFEHKKDSQNLEEALENENYTRDIPEDVNAFMIGEGRYCRASAGGSLGRAGYNFGEQMIPVIFYSIKKR